MSRKPWEIYEAVYETSAVKRSGYPREPFPQVAFAGRSNVGKSSLLNALARRRGLAKTSSTPGRTQMINFFRVNNAMFWVDLPGYGYAKAPPAEKEKWRRMIEEYLASNPNLRLLIMLLDARREPSPLDDQLTGFLNHAGIPFLPVLTKCDKLSRAALSQTRRAMARHYQLPEGLLPVAVSAENGMGREELLKIILDAVRDIGGEKAGDDPLDLANGAAPFADGNAHG